MCLSVSEYVCVCVECSLCCWDSVFGFAMPLVGTGREEEGEGGFPPSFLTSGFVWVMCVDS